MKRTGITAGPLDQYIRSLHNGERFYASWVRDYLIDPGDPNVILGPGVSPPVYPATWREDRAKAIAARVIRLYGEEEGWRNERKFEAERSLDAIVAAEARKDASHRRLEYALRSGRSRSRGFTLTGRSTRTRYRRR